MTETSELGSMASVLRELASAPMELLVRGTVVDDQYEIERAIGHGAMGVVYLARDTRLDRNVAIKVARNAQLAQTSREAMLLARLSHPNVVVIHQVGTLDGKVYVAMEYVAGATARGWCEGKTAAAILDLYAQVGDGLAAAHAAGLVHRDFKPDNVLVGEDGRGRVADFGLAREISDAADERAGTPRYMPPEQLAGGDVDARADQFAFCESLAEALGDRRVSRHVAVALVRGRSVERDARFPSMKALLVQLRKRPIGAMPVVAATSAALAIGVGLFAMSRHHEVDECATAGQEMTAGWPARHAELQQALAGGGVPDWVARVRQLTVERLDHYAARWTDASRASCQAAWTSTLHDLATQCLARQRGALTATVGVLTEPNTAPTYFETIVGALDRPEACTDPVYLKFAVPPPTDPELSAKAATALVGLHRASALNTAGRFDEARRVLAGVPVVPVPLVAALRAYLEAFLQQIGDGDRVAAARANIDAYFIARAAGDHEAAMETAANASHAWLDASKDADAATWARLAEIESNELVDAHDRSNALAAVAAVSTARGDASHALELLDKAIALQRDAGDTSKGAELLQERADANIALGKYDAALSDLDAAIDMRTKRLGAGHPGIATLESKRSHALLSAGRDEEAVTAARRALAIAEASMPDSDFVDTAVGALGAALGHLARYDEALALLDRVQAADVKRDGARSYNVASDHNNRCDLLTKMKRYPDARTECRLASAIFTEVAGGPSPDVATSQYNLTLALAPEKKWQETREAATVGIAALAGQPDTPTLGLLLTSRGHAEYELRDFAAARTDLERAIAVLAAAAANPAWLPAAQLHLGVVDARTGKRDAARTLISTAHDAFATLHDPRADDATFMLGELK